jgi:hypothetical protein
MIVKTSPEQLLRMSRILDSGIPLDPVVVEALRASCRGLSICQIGSPVENTVFDLEHGGTGYMLGVEIRNNTPKILSIEQYRLEPPWPESDFRWLEDPRKLRPREFNYSFPQYGPEGLDRECVLNHHVGRNGRLLPGDCIHGLLCGVGEAGIPDEYQDRQLLSMQLSVVATRGTELTLDIDLILNREAQIRRQRQLEKFQRRPKRRGILAW